MLVLTELLMPTRTSAKFAGRGLSATARTLALFGLVGGVLFLPGCTSSTGPGDDDDDILPPGPAQVEIQAAYDQTDVAIRVSWISRGKNFPSALAGAARIFPGQYHDLLSHDGTRFTQSSDADRLQEDRVNLMIMNGQTASASFSNSGCYSTCHSGMASHRTTTGEVVDLWHWRGGRTGPMGYAEDTGIDGTGRIRDGQGAPTSVWTRSAGDRIREDQAALAGTGHPTAEGLPRFVFNKGKMMPGGFQIPRYFLWTDAGGVMLNAVQEVPTVKTVAVNRSLLVAYQDRGFDPVDKVNAIDVGYLVHVATGATAHLPSHLRTAGTAAYVSWTAFWSAELGVALGASAQAEAVLAAIQAERTAAGGKGMVARSVGFIYPSSQHNISSTHAFDAASNKWSVILYRKLNTGDLQDVNLAGLGTGQNFVLGLAVHDQGAGSESHDITVPYTLGIGASADIRAVSVPNVRSVSWATHPSLSQRFISRQYVEIGDPWTLQTLLNPATHKGSGFVNVLRCQACHGLNEKRIDN